MDTYNYNNNFIDSNAYFRLFIVYRYFANFITFPSLIIITTNELITCVQRKYYNIINKTFGKSYTATRSTDLI